MATQPTQGFLARVSGKTKQLFGLAVSAGAADAGKLVATGSDEKSRGQIPLTDADLMALPGVVQNPERVVLGTKNRLGKEQIAYIKQMPDGSTLYLEEVRTGRKELAAVTARKYPATMNIESIVSTLHPNAQGDGGNGVIVLRSPASGNSAGETKNLLKPSRGSDAYFGTAAPAGSDYTSDQRRAAEHVFGVQQKETLAEQAMAMRHNLGTKLRQGLVDQFAPIKEVSEKAYILARLSKGSDGAVEAALLYGKPFLRDGVADVDVKDGGFAKVLASLKGEETRFFQWVAAQRAERLKSEGKEPSLRRRGAQPGFAGDHGSGRQDGHCLPSAGGHQGRGEGDARRRCRALGRRGPVPAGCHLGHELRARRRGQGHGALQAVAEAITQPMFSHTRASPLSRSTQRHGGLRSSVQALRIFAGMTCGIPSRHGTGRRVRLRTSCNVWAAGKRWKWWSDMHTLHRKACSLQHRALIMSSPEHSDYIEKAPGSCEPRASIWCRRHESNTRPSHYE